MEYSEAADGARSIKPHYMLPPEKFIKGACPDCGGDIYTHYKYGRLWKCVKCSRTFQPGKLKKHD